MNDIFTADVSDEGDFFGVVIEDRAYRYPRKQVGTLRGAAAAAFVEDLDLVDDAVSVNEVHPSPMNALTQPFNGKFYFAV